MLIRSVPAHGFGRKELAHQVPMPRVTANRRPWIFKRLELETLLAQANPLTIGDQALAICGNQVRHLVPLPHMTVQPQPAVHRVDHSIATVVEFKVERALIGLCDHRRER